MDKYNPNEHEGQYNPRARDEDRSQLADDIEAFLASGGEVKTLRRGERADPPRKPENNYGRGSI